jgi:hypothetical protein
MRKGQSMPAVKTQQYPDLGRSDLYGGSWLKKLMSETPSATRTRKLIDRCAQIAEQLPVSPGVPGTVIAAHDACLANLAAARGAADALETAHQAVEDSLRADVTGAANALRKGAAIVASALTRPKARAAEELALTTCLAAESMALDALQALLDATRETWTQWREVLVQDTQAATDEATAALKAALPAIGKRGEMLAQIAALDHAIVHRFPEEAEAHGLPTEHGAMGKPLLRDRPKPGQVSAALGVDALVSELAARLAEVPAWATALETPLETEYNES